VVSKDKVKEDLILVETGEVVEIGAVIEEAVAVRVVEIEEVAEARVVETVVVAVQEDKIKFRI
jgi:transcriptional regulatory protein LevR